MPCDRVTAPDLMLIWPEDQGWPQDIGALAILDGRTLFDADGRFLIDAVREHIGRRLHLLPRFRQLLYWPRFGLGWPLWADHSAFDIAEHVGVLPVLAPGDEHQLLLACERLRRRPLNRSRPLWEMWFLPGLPDGRVGFFIKLHHAIADGVAGIAALGAFLDLVPDPPAMSVPGWTSAPMPSNQELFRDNLRRRLQELDRALSALASPIRTLRRMKRGWPAVREVFAEGRAPRTSPEPADRLGSPVGHHPRQLGRREGDRPRSPCQGQRRPVDHARRRLRRPTSEPGGTRRRSRLAGVRSRVPALTAAWSSPGERRRGDGGTAPRRGAGSCPPASTDRSGHCPEEEEGTPSGRQSVPKRPTPARLPALDAPSAPHECVRRQCSGPAPTPVLRPRPVLELFPVVPITGNISIGVGALSYAGQFNITGVADRDTCPDLEVFVDGVRRSLDALERSILVSAP